MTYRHIRMKKYVDKVKRQIYRQNLTFYGCLNLLIK
jgi:hypothetical protein